MSWKAGDIVWAKLGSYPFWPSQIVKVSDVPKNVKQQLHPQPHFQICYFFGSKNYGLISETSIFGFEEAFERFGQAKKPSKQLAKAIEEARSKVHGGSSEVKSRDQDSEGEIKKEKNGTHKEKKVKDDSTSNDMEADEPLSKPEHKKKEDKEKAKKEKGEEKKSKKKEEDKKEKDKKGKKEDSDSKDTREEEKQKPPDSKDQHQERKRKLIDESMKEREQEKKKVKKEDGPTPKQSLGTPKSNAEFDTNAEATPAKNSEGIIVHTPTKNPISATVIANMLNSIYKHPVTQYNKLKQISISNSSATTKARFSGARASSQVEIHSIVASIHYLMDVTCFIALVEKLHENEQPVTVDISASVVQLVPGGSEVTIKAKVKHHNEQAGLFFLESEVWNQNKLLATGKVVKSVALEVPTLPDEKKIKSDDL